MAATNAVAACNNKQFGNFLFEFLICFFGIPAQSKTQPTTKTKLQHG